MDDFVEAAIKERNNIKQKLAKYPDFERYLLLEQVIASYRKQEPLIALQHDIAARLSASPKTGTKLDKILRLSKDCIDNNNGAASMSQIYEYLAKSNVDVTKPALSAYLSSFKKSNVLMNDREQGTWSYKVSEPTQLGG